MIRNIVGAKDPILRQKAKAVAKVDKKVRLLAKDLVDTLKVQKDPEGVGLAACQIGKPQRLFAMVHSNKTRVIINPEIISTSPKSKPPAKKSKSKQKKTILEGCLSIPYFYGPLKRPQTLTLKYLNLDGQEKTEIFRGFPAQIVQHEVDHLNGILFTDHILKTKTKLYKLDSKTDEWEEVELT